VAGASANGRRWNPQSITTCRHAASVAHVSTRGEKAEVDRKGIHLHSCTYARFSLRCGPGVGVRP
jgi:hypothetical protein